MDAPIKRKLEYQNALSTLATWWKALFLTPFWGLLVIPVLGAVALVFVNSRSLDFVTSPGWQISLGLTILACMGYFLDDLLKRVITVTKDAIHFGLQRFPLDKLVSVGVEYPVQQLMPHRIILRFRDGRILKLEIDRLRNDQFESFSHFVETRLPQVNIDPVVLTLMRCRRAAGKAISDTGDSVEIRYNSRFVLAEMAEVFTRSWDDWCRFGPILLSIFTAPFWTMVIAQLFMLPIVVLQLYKSSSDVQLVQAVFAMSTKMYETLGQFTKGEYYQVVVDVAGQPIVVALLVVFALALTGTLLRTLLSPNRILVQSDSVKLLFRWESYCFCTESIPIDTIKCITLFKPDELADPSRWMLRINLTNGRHTDLRLSALSPQEKSRFTKAIQRLAPQVSIDPDLLETLIPKQDFSYTELWLQSLSSAPERKSLDPLQPGQALSSLRYQVIRCLGVGGQGTAYLAKDTGLVESRLNDMVVLKEAIFPVYAESDIRMQALERFEKEANLLRRLEHKGIVSLREFFLEDHRGYLVMEHVDGRTLKQIVEEDGPMSEMAVRDLALQMSDILCYLHANGVVHRDFTPDNLIVSKSGELKLIDFNVAQQQQIGSSGTIVGKQGYLPLEQFRGKATAQSDLYALGATLQFLLTGEEPEPITQSSPLEKSVSCSQSLDQIVRDCTALQAQKRMSSADELKERLLARSQPSSGEPEARSEEEDEGVILDIKQQEEILEMERS